MVRSDGKSDASLGAAAVSPHGKVWIRPGLRSGRLRVSGTAHLRSLRETVSALTLMTLMTLMTLGGGDPALEDIDQILRIEIAAGQNADDFPPSGSAG